ncbi:hypothetical protein C8F04DRAFT_1102328 [Mycena alexandri]|uniref:Uncharacterized protein n=1 Tax=Mycena alexandri TaxID=1745969 RepID=A0AAD6SW23_9AGAR|nr:hypothetical protein C8F04DRAFT_1102328 [Mycena alexandri]
MSATTSPSYSEALHDSAGPGQHPIVHASLPKATGDFTRVSKHGDATLRLTAQHDNIDLPAYEVGGVVAGTVELSKTDHISTVEFKVEGHLRVIETGEDGHFDATLVSETTVLWVAEGNDSVCPSVLPFSVTLPTTFVNEGETYALPPTYSVERSGIPGFSATVQYSISAIIHKRPSLLHPAPLLHLGNTIVSTPFIYNPRTRPAHPIPPSLKYADGGFIEDSEWQRHESVIKPSPGADGLQDIVAKFYLPARRIFCGSDPIPFHLTIESDAPSLAAFQQFAPTTGNSENAGATQVQIIRQSKVHVKNAVNPNARTDMWREDYIGKGTFKIVDNSPTSMSYTGEIKVAAAEVTSFKSAGLTVQDFVSLSVTPPGANPPIVGMRKAVQVWLTTDAQDES